MGLISYALGQTSIVLRVKILDSSVSTGAGKTGLTNTSTGLNISAIADNEAATTTYTAAGSTIDAITTLGTYAAPASGHCAFKELDATNHKGVYEIQLANARYAVANSKSLLISISGATNAADTDVVIPLTSINPYDASRMGLASGSTGNLPALDVNGNVGASVNRINNQIATAAGAVSFPSAVGDATAANQTTINNQTTAAQQQSNVQAGMTTQGYTTTRAGYLDTLNGIVAAIWASATRTLTAASDSSGVTTLLSRIGQALGFDGSGNVKSTPQTGVIVTTNTDKSGYSLTQSFPANFASLAITGGGAVTVGTNSDKTGYSLTQSFPTNFGSLAISSGGAATVGAYATGEDPATLVWGAGTRTLTDKTGYTLAANGLDSISVAAPPAGATVTFPQAVVRLYRRFFKKTVLDTTANTLKTYADDDTTVLTTQSATNTGGVQTTGDAS